MAPRILIFGTGSIGSVYAWVLSRSVPASHIYAVCRSNYSAASEHGFIIHSTVFGNDLHVKPVVVRSVDEAASLLASSTSSSSTNEDDSGDREPEVPYFDYILVCSKALPTTPSTPDLLRPAITPGKTTIVLIQNGIGIEPPYQSAFPDNPLLSTVVYLPATTMDQDQDQDQRGGAVVVQHKEIELLHVGTYPAATSTASGTAATAQDAACAFVDLLTRSGATAHYHEDVQAERWSKLLVNASWNPICALTRLRDAQYLACDGAGGENEEEHHHQVRAFIRDVMREIRQVAQAHGYGDRVTADLVDAQLARATARPTPGVQPSMLADALAGRRLEVDAIVGNVVRLARARGVDTPLLRVIWMLALGLDRSLAMSRTS